MSIRPAINWRCGLTNEEAIVQVLERILGDPDQFEQGGAAAGFLRGRLGVLRLVFRGVGGREGGAIQDLDVVTQPLGLVGGQAFAGGAVGAVLGVGRFGADVVEARMREDLADGLTAQGEPGFNACQRKAQKVFERV